MPEPRLANKFAPRLTPEFRAEVLARYRRRQSVNRIVLQLNSSRGTVSMVLHEAGIEITVGHVPIASFAENPTELEIAEIEAVKAEIKARNMAAMVDHGPARFDGKVSGIKEYAIKAVQGRTIFEPK